METVEVVIKVSKDLYEGIECRNGELETEYVCDELMKAIDNGTVLPKGHGDLVDMNTVTSTYNLQGELTSYDAVVVLEADGESEHGKEQQE